VVKPQLQKLLPKRQQNLNPLDFRFVHKSIPLWDAFFNFTSWGCAPLLGKKISVHEKVSHSGFRQHRGRVHPYATQCRLSHFRPLCRISPAQMGDRKTRRSGRIQNQRTHLCLTQTQHLHESQRQGGFTPFNARKIDPESIVSDYR